MAVIECFVVGGVVLIGQGVYTLRTGDIRLLGFLMRPTPHTTGVGRSKQIIGGMFFLACGVWVLHIPFFASLRAVSVASWASRNSGLLLAVAFCGGLGIFLLIWPGVFLKWLQSSYPQIPTNERWTLMIPRAIGVGALVIAVQLLAGILYYAPHGGSR